ncbi:MAG TPA: hypothetical protein VMV92_15420 [Streptosporangiaceae bacterium]|nr:hypothetical protein [Streptosporangiaceae bacterium]
MQQPIFRGRWRVSDLEERIEESGRETVAACKVFPVVRAINKGAAIVPGRSLAGQGIAFGLLVGKAR